MSYVYKIKLLIWRFDLFLSFARHIQVYLSVKCQQHYNKVAYLETRSMTLFLLIHIQLWPCLHSAKYLFLCHHSFTMRDTNRWHIMWNITYYLHTRFGTLVLKFVSIGNTMLTFFRPPAYCIHCYQIYGIETLFSNLLRALCCQEYSYLVLWKSMCIS